MCVCTEKDVWIHPPVLGIPFIEEATGYKHRAYVKDHVEMSLFPKYHILITDQQFSHVRNIFTKHMFNKNYFMNCETCSA